MAEEPIKPYPPVDTAALIAEVEELRKSIADRLDDYKKAKEAALGMWAKQHVEKSKGNCKQKE